MPAKRCLKCGRFFAPELSCENTQKYCSTKCSRRKHVETYRSNPKNMDKIRITCKRYRKNHPEVIRKVRKKYMKTEKYKKYYEKTRPKRRKYLREYMRKYNDNRREELREYSRMQYKKKKLKQNSEKDLKTKGVI